MLADEPPVSRVHAGGVVSVRISGSSAGAHEVPNMADQRSGNPRRAEGDFRHLAEDFQTVGSQECRTASLAEATITWRSGAKRCSLGNTDICHDEIAGATTPSQTIPIRAYSPAETTSVTSEQLVHIIRVQTSPPVNTADSGVDMERRVKTTIEPHTKNSTGTIRITTNSTDGDFHLMSVKSSGEYCQDKISLAVGSPLINKAEDERSSSGASSAPASDCERSDSDREADDGTDSGFSTSRRHCASIVLSAKNVSNGSVTPNFGCKNNSGITKVPVGCTENGSVKLSISSYADKTDHEKKNILLISDAEAADKWSMQFHMRELDSPPSNGKQDTGDIQSKITAAHALLSGQDEGSYTLKNKVKSSINSLLVQSITHRSYDQEEMGRVVFYTTSMGIIRNTFDRCRKVRKILETLMVRFEERDVFMNRGFQQEVRERLGISRVVVPQVFVEGRHLGAAEVIEQLNEIGHLRELLRPYKRHSVGGVCRSCGGYRYLLCSVCGGSKKSVTHRHHFSEDLVALRCVSCDESGLIRCPECVNGEG